MKRLYTRVVFIAMLIGATTQVSFSQSINAIWGETSPGISSPDFIKTDGDGNVFRTSFYDSLLVKMDPSGAVLWGVVFPIQPEDSAAVVKGLAIDVDGNAYVAGSYKSGQIKFGAITLNADTTERLSSLFLVKYDSDGHELWAITTGIDASTTITSIEADKDGNVFLFGDLTSDYTVFATTTLDQGLFHVKVSTDGDILWAKSILSDGQIFAAGVTTDSEGNSIVAGNFGGATCTLGTNVINNSGSGVDLFVAKFDSNGDVVWANSFGNPATDDWVESIATDQEDNICIAGNHYVQISSSVRKMFLKKYNSSGGDLWEKIFDDDYQYCTESDLTIDANGNLYLIGLFRGNQITFGSLVLSTSSISNLLLVASFTKDGDTRWAGLEDNCIGEQIETDHNGNVYITGNMNGPSLTLGSVVLNNINTPNGNSRFLAKLNNNNTTIAILSTLSTQKQWTAVSPNPSSGKVRIDGLNENHWGIRVHNMTGQTVIQSAFDGTQTVLDFTGYPKGLYSFNLQNDREGIYTGKIIIE